MGRIERSKVYGSLAFGSIFPTYLRTIKLLNCITSTCLGIGNAAMLDEQNSACPAAHNWPSEETIGTVRNSRFHGRPYNLSQKHTFRELALSIRLYPFHNFCHIRPPKSARGSL